MKSTLKKEILNNFRTLITNYQKSVMVDLLALLLSSILQCKKLCPEGGGSVIVLSPAKRSDKTKV